MLLYIIILIACSFLLGCIFHKKFLTPMPYIRISRDYDQLYTEYLQLMRQYKGNLEFKDFLIIKYDLWGSPMKYVNKLILFGFVKNKLQVIAMLNKEGK